MKLVEIRLLISVSLACGMLGCDKPAQQVSAPPANALIEPSAPVTDRATATPRPTTVGTKIDDGVVTTKVKSALIADPDVKGLDIKVETRKGEVQLSGFVDSQAQVDRAVQIASGVEGVNAIDNKMSLKAGKATVGNTVDDSIVTAKVKTALVADSTVKSSDIAVVTRKGDVQLSGYVDNQSQIDRAIEVARGIDGVKKVENKMAVKK